MPPLALRNSLAGLVSLFYPASCAACAHPVDASEYLCPVCIARISRVRFPFCAKCSQPFPGAISDRFTCANCEGRILHFETAVALYRSRGPVRKAIHDLKYGSQLYLRHLVGRWLADALEDPRLSDRRFDAIVPVPLHPTRKRERGFNQAELLANEVHQLSGIPLRDLLQRIRYTTTQTQFDRNERMENLKGAFRLRRGSNVQGCRVLLIDDVLTTGSTLSECAFVLKTAGAASVRAATAARG